MKRALWILSGIIILISMLGLLFFAGAIYDAEKKQDIDTFFFQLPPKAANRIDSLVAANDIPENILREMIVARFVNDYFYVIPDSQNADMRAEFKNTNNTPTVLRELGRKNVYDKWKNDIAPEIKELAAKGVLRKVKTFPDIQESESGHLIVKYELKTWTKPNDVLALPEVTTGVLYLDVTKAPIRVKTTEDVLNKLKLGYDPVSAFSFRVLDVI